MFQRYQWYSHECFWDINDIVMNVLRYQWYSHECFWDINDKVMNVSEIYRWYKVMNGALCRWSLPNCSSSVLIKQIWNHFHLDITKLSVTQFSSPAANLSSFDIGSGGKPVSPCDYWGVVNICYMGDSYEMTWLAATLTTGLPACETYLPPRSCCGNIYTHLLLHQPSMTFRVSSKKSV